MNGSDPLASALGAVREGAQAIENLLHLLGSRRVGPKAIGVAIVDVRDGCAGQHAAIEVLKQELVDRLRADEEASALAASLLDRALARAAALGDQLHAVKKVDVDAKARLAIEAAVREASGELDGILSLASLLARAATARTTELDARDVLHGQACGAARPAAPSEATKLTFVGDARVVVEAVALARSLVAAAVGDPSLASLRVTASMAPGDRVKVQIAADPPSPRSSERASGPAPRVPAPRPVDVQAKAVALAVARLAGFDVTIAPSGRMITLVFGARARGAERAPGVVEPGA